MPTITATELKTGTAIILNGIPHLVLSAEHGVKSRQRAKTRVRLKNLKTGATLQHAFTSTEKISLADLGYRRVQYLYQGKNDLVFMDLETYEQSTINTRAAEEITKYLTEGMEVDLLLYEGRPISVKLPAKVALKVVKTMPGVRGDTAAGGNKPATLESGLTVNVPLFISEGDTIYVNTGTGEYVERAS